MTKKVHRKSVKKHYLDSNEGNVLVVEYPKEANEVHDASSDEKKCKSHD